MMENRRDLGWLREMKTRKEIEQRFREKEGLKERGREREREK